jgi:hypothetical protein
MRPYAEAREFFTRRAQFFPASGACSPLNAVAAATSNDRITGLLFLKYILI